MRALLVEDDDGIASGLASHLERAGWADFGLGSGQGSGLGLGLGHQVIARIAEVHGGSFEEVAAPAGWRRCYRLCFA